MKRFDKALVDRLRSTPPARLRHAFASMVFALGAAMFTTGPAGAADPRACSESCDRKASDCLDVCEAKFKEDKPRVECKMQCTIERQKCEAACATP